MLKRYPQALMVFFFGTSLLTGCASTEEKEVLNQNLSASNSLHANGGDMCPPGHTVFKYGNCYPRGTDCKPGYYWLKPNLCRKESCPAGYDGRVGNKCVKKNNSLSWQTDCRNSSTYNGKKFCKGGCGYGYQKCVRLQTYEQTPYYFCCRCDTGTYNKPYGTQYSYIGQIKTGFCYNESTEIPVDEYSLQVASSPPKRNCSDLPVTVCGGAAFSHCVVRGEGDNRRCAWNVAPHYPYCEINGGGATCYDME